MKIGWVISILCFGGHLFYCVKYFLQKVNMNYHAKSGASSFKIERILINFVFWWPFCFFVSILFLKFFLWKVNMNYRARSGEPCLKIEWVMINFVFWLPFCFWRPSCFRVIFFGGGSIWTSIWNFGLLAWKMSELWLILCFGSHLVFELIFLQRVIMNLIINSWVIYDQFCVLTAFCF